MEQREVNIEPLSPTHASDTWMLRDGFDWRYTECDTPLPATLDSECQAYQFLIQSKSDKRYAIIVNDKCIGVVSLKKIGYGTAAIGYYILDKSLWGKGVCTEAVRQIMKIGFDNLNLDMLYIWVNCKNIASYKIASNLGFYNVGMSFTKRNVHRFEMTKSVWRQLTKE